jgi:hypothetical protein
MTPGNPLRPALSVVAPERTSDLEVMLWGLVPDVTWRAYQFILDQDVFNLSKGLYKALRDINVTR